MNTSGDEVLHPGSASGELLVLDEPLSFWGGTDRDGTIIDRHHPQRFQGITGKILAMPAGRGSSSSSSVLAEQIRLGTAPAGLILREPDAILVIGAWVAAELYGTAMPIIRMAPPAYAGLRSGNHIRL